MVCLSQLENNLGSLPQAQGRHALQPYLLFFIVFLRKNKLCISLLYDPLAIGKNENFADANVDDLAPASVVIRWAIYQINSKNYHK